MWLTLRVCVCSPAVCVRSLEVTVSQSSVQVARGQAAILPCTFTTSAALNNLYIIWMVTPLANANQPEQVTNYTSYAVVMIKKTKQEKSISVEFFHLPFHNFFSDEFFFKYISFLE